MTSVGAFEAKTNLNVLLKRVEKGETIQITRRGVPVARLVPVQAAEENNDLDELIRRFREMRKGTSLGGLRIRDLIDEGRRF